MQDRTPVPKAYEELTKTEIKRLEGIGVLERNSDSKHAAPTFIQKKKTGDIRILTDFQKLNAMLIRKPHPLPKNIRPTAKTYGLSLGFRPRP